MEADAFRNRPNRFPPADDFAELRLPAAECLDACRARRLVEETGDEIELHGKPGASLQSEAVEKSGARIEVLEALHIAMNDDVLPGNECVVEHENGVILIKAGGERIIPRRTGGGGGELVGWPADKLDAGGIHGRDEHHHHARIRNLLAHVLAKKIVMGERRVGGYDLGARHDDACVGLLLDGDVDVLDLFDRLVAVYRRIYP